MFAEVIGHERVKRLLERAVSAGRVPPSLLLTGPEGVGKRTLALALGRALVCESAARCEPRCAVCRRVEQGTHPDVIPVRPATQVIKIDQVRAVVREIMGRPFEARRRMVVIDDAHALTEEAANALLKSLEEPPPSSYVALVTSAPQALLPTIRSRCQVLRMGPLTAAQVEAHLRGAAGLSAEDAQLRAALAGGSLAAALALESDVHRALRERMLALLESPPDPAERAQAVDQLVGELDDLTAALGVLRSLLRDVEALRLGAAPKRLLNRDLEPRLAALARRPLAARAAGLAARAEESVTLLRGNANKHLTLDLFVDAVADAAALPP